jgi:hypothetical protein
LLVISCAALAWADGPEKEERPVTAHGATTTSVTQDATTLSRGALATTVLEKDAVALVQGSEIGSIDGPPVAGGELFDRVCASVNAETPGTSSVEVSVRVRFEGGESAWLPLGVVAAPDDAAKLPRSCNAPPGDAKVAIDTVELPRANGKEVTARLVLRRGKGGESPRVHRVAVVAWPHGKRDPDAKAHPVWGKVLEVVERSQRVEDPAISMRICSATSLGMVLAFHGFALETKQVCHEVLDRQAGIYGNWALNVAFAGRLGLDARIARFGSFEPLEEEILAGRPVVLTHRWVKGELSGAPISSSEGHLIVARGFTEAGDLVVNDPAADTRKGESVRRVYQRAEIEKTWLGNADGVCYVISGGAAR